MPEVLLRIVRMAEHPERNVVDPGRVAADERLERLLVTGLGHADLRRLVVMVAGRIVEKRASCRHASVRRGFVASVTPTGRIDLDLSGSRIRPVDIVRSIRWTEGDGAS
jgi:hypothetical protein